MRSILARVLHIFEVRAWDMFSPRGQWLLGTDITSFPAIPNSGEVTPDLEEINAGSKEFISSSKYIYRIF